jgi:hypothetical protein
MKEHNWHSFLQLSEIYAFGQNQEVKNELIKKHLCQRIIESMSRGESSSEKERIIHDVVKA